MSDNPSLVRHGCYSLKADRTFGEVAVYQSIKDGEVSGEVRCTAIGTPGYLAREYGWEDKVDLGPVGEHLRNEVTDVAQHKSYHAVFGRLGFISSPDEAEKSIDKAMSACLIVTSGVSLREAIRSVAHGDAGTN